MTVRLFAAVVAVFLAGCAVKPQTPVALDRARLGPQTGTVGVATTTLPKNDMYVPGAGCLLCVMFAQGANSGLAKHATTLAPEGVAELRGQLADALRARGVNVVPIAEPVQLDSLPSKTGDAPNLARRDFAPLRAKYGIDRLLLVDVKQIGFERQYSSYIPAGDPKALMRGEAYLVDLSTNTYEWFVPVEAVRAAAGAWDEPPKYPGLTNAYYQSLEVGKDAILKPWKN